MTSLVSPAFPKGALARSQFPDALMATHYLDFEKPIADLEAKIEELSLLSDASGDFDNEIEGLRKKAEQLRKKTYAGLDP